MNYFVINNVNIVTPTEVIPGGSVIVENGKIKEISRVSHIHEPSEHFVIEANGNYLMPGIIDIHTDAMDHEICPRPGADFPVEVAFSELEKRMCSAGITTVFHSIHLGYYDAEHNQRSKYTRTQIFEEVYKASQKSTLINNRIHLRYEITGVKDYELCFELVDKGLVKLFSFMDHTPGQGQYPLEKYIVMAKKRGLNEEQAIEELQKRQGRPKISKEQIVELIRFLQERNIHIASHDDDTVAKVEENHALGIDICEFPINIETAQRAIELDMHVVGGASNVLRGGSTGGNLHVQEAIALGAINVLCSDYYSPSLLHSTFMLFQQNVLSLPEAVNLVTRNAAISVGLEQTKGSIEPGKDADMLMINYADNFPTVTYTIVGGNISGKYNLIERKVHEFSN